MYVFIYMYVIWIYEMMAKLPVQCTCRGQIPLTALAVCICGTYQIHALSKALAHLMRH